MLEGFFVPLAKLRHRALRVPVPAGRTGLAGSYMNAAPLATMRGEQRPWSF